MLEGADGFTIYNKRPRALRLCKVAGLCLQPRAPLCLYALVLAPPTFSALFVASGCLTEPALRNTAAQVLDI